MAHGLGDEIAILDGLELGAAAAAPKSGSSTAAIVRGFNPDAELVAYLNATEANTAKAMDVDRRNPVAGANYSGGSSYAPGMPLLYSSAGLAGAPNELVATPLDGSGPMGTNMITTDNETLAQMSVLNGDAALQRNLASTRYGGMPTVIVEPGANTGRTRTGGSNYFTGASLVPSGAGLAELALAPRRMNFVPDAALRARFSDNDAYMQFERMAGASTLRRLEQTRQRAVEKRSPLLPRVEHRIAHARLFRSQVLQTPAQLTRPQLLALWKLSGNKANTAAQLHGFEGLAMLNHGLDGLEGRFARKLRRKLKKGLKQGFKVVGKVAGKLAKKAINFAPMVVGMPPMPISNMLP